MWVHGTCLLNLYVPPGHDSVATAALTLFWEQHRIQSKQWAVLGDFNNTPADSSPGQWLQSCGGVVLPNFPTDGSRWQSDRFIDWAMASHPDKMGFASVNSDLHFSDHKGFWVTIPNVRVTSKKGRLKPSPKWIKPNEITTEDWQAALDVTWKAKIQSSLEFHTLSQMLQVGPNENNASTVQQEWDLFMTCLNLLFTQTIRDLLASSTDDAVLSELRKINHQQGLRAKGSQASFQWVNIPYKCKGDPQPGEKGRLLRRRLARLFEIRRCCKRHVLPPEDLLRKVWPQVELPLTCQELHRRATSDIQQVQAQRVAWEEACKQEALTSWKRRINQPDLKPLGAWLRSSGT